MAHAYAYGGAELAIKTLNQNFGLDIQEYVTVNFAQLTKIIDAMGGIDLEITEAEREAANGVLLTENPNGKTIKSSGKVHLTGEQATAYSRVRKIDNDIERSNRQQKVLVALFDKALSLGTAQYPGVIKQLLPIMETSLSYGDIIGFAPIVLSSGMTVERNIVPNDADNAKGGNYDGAWYWRYDLDAAGERLRQFIYEE